VFENRVLRRIFGRKRVEVTGECRKLLDEELSDLYFSPDSVWVMKLRWVEHIARMGERRFAYIVVGRKPGGKRPLGRPRCIWEDNIKMDLQEEGWGAWTGLIWLKLGTGGRLL